MKNIRTSVGIRNFQHCGSVSVWLIAMIGLFIFVALLLTSEASYYLQQALYTVSTLILWATGG